MLFWVVAAETQSGFRARSIRALKSWWPYLLVWLADLAWLIYYYRSGVYVSYDLTVAGAFPSLSDSLLGFADALWKAGFYSWFQVVLLAARSISAPSTLLSFGLAVLAFAAAALYLLRLRPESQPAGASAATASAEEPAPAGGSLAASFAIPALIIGVVGILLGRIPSFAAGLPLTLQSSYDRFMISMMLGGSLFIAGLVALLIRNQRARTCTFAALLALGVGQQFFNANIFRRDWQGQQQVYWQLAWRIPALQPNTALVTQQMPLDYETDLSMTAALNWIYAPQTDPAALSYALVYSEKRLGGSVLPNLNPDTPMNLAFRTVSFTGNTSETITIYVPRNGCLRVLDPYLGDLETYAGYPSSVTTPISLSDPSRIITSASAPALPSPPFESEPPHAWCYFYEKAELARQIGKWQEIVALGSEAAQKSFSPQDPIEWLPFIEGYARAGNLPLAEKISRQAWSEGPKIHHGLCVVWSRLRTDGPDAARSAASQLIGEFGCGH